MEINRVWEMPNSKTFKIKAIRNFGYSREKNKYSQNKYLGE